MKDDMPAAAKYWPQVAIDKYREVEAMGVDDSRIPIGTVPLWIRRIATEAAENEINLLKGITHV